jgi:GNAT superfamily N-acetyltransferase
MTTTLELRPYEDADEANVVALLRTAMGEGPSGSRSTAYFRWKHIDNPFGRSLMLVATKDGMLVGLRAFMRWRFVSEDATVDAVRAVDTATHPDARRMGIFSQLTQAALGTLRDEGALIFNTPNEKSLPGYLKLGWKAVGRVPVSIRVVRPVSFARHVRARDASGDLGKVDAPTAGDVLADSWMPALLSRSAERTTHRLETPRTVAYLRWRYSAASGLDYRAVTTGAGNASGVAIFRVRMRGALREATITELLTADDDVATTRRLLSEVRRAAAVDHVAYRPLVRSRAGSPARFGFIPARSGATLVVNDLTGLRAVDPQRLDAWSLSIGDLEVF